MQLDSSRMDQLTISEQLIIFRLINHLASQPNDYRNHAFQRLKEISEENPWVSEIQGFDKKTFLENHPINQEEYLHGITPKA